MSYLVKAINNLKPTAEFSFTEENYSTIKWDVLDGAAPTLAEINAEITAIKTKEAKSAKDQDAAKASLLARLGLTENELAILLG
jgi:hypothetical protein